MKESEACNWSQGFEDDLLRELLYDESPYVLSPQEIAGDPDNYSVNKLISSIYSGPTITDIGKALVASSYTNNTPELSALTRFCSLINDNPSFLCIIENPSNFCPSCCKYVFLLLHINCKIYRCIYVNICITICIASLRFLI